MHHHDHCSHSHHDTTGRAFIIGILLNSLFIMAEVIYGLKANSLALLADAGHNASDVLGLFMAWSAAWLAKRGPTERYTYGLRSSSILAALANAMLLLVVTGGIAWEAVWRFSNPQDVAGGEVMAVAALGVLINGATALLFMGRQKHDLNVRGAYLHMAADAAVSLGVVVAGALVLFTGASWIDPLVSLIVAAIIVLGTWGLLMESLGLALHAVPRHIDPSAVRSFLKTVPGVMDLHDLHIWAMSTTETALSVHLIMKDGHPGDAFIRSTAKMLQDHFGIGHATIQIELGDDYNGCPLSPGHII